MITCETFKLTPYDSPQEPLEAWDSPLRLRGDLEDTPPQLVDPLLTPTKGVFGPDESRLARRPDAVPARGYALLQPERAAR